MSDNPQVSRGLVPNCFDADTYYRVDLREGVMRTSFGVKSCTFSGYALQGIYLALKDEVGPAWRVVMRECGAAWGKRFAERFLAEIGEFYGQSLDEMAMPRFTALFEEYFAVSGWGRPRLDFSLIDRGLIQVDVQNEVMGDLLRGSGERAGAVLEGVLRTFFSQLTGKEMDCCETASIAQGKSSSRFVIALSSRLRPVVAWLEQGASHEQVIERLSIVTP